MELQIIKYIQNFDNLYFIEFIKFLDFFDRNEFFLLLIPTVWFLSNWKTGYKFFLILFLSGLTNRGLKSLFAVPRPFELDSSLGMLKVSGYAFPSGAAQTTALLTGILLFSWKSDWKWPLALLYFVLVSFSRIYLGVHYPLDILGGWTVGLGLLGVYLVVFPTIEQKFQEITNIQFLLLNSFFFSLLMVIFPISFIMRTSIFGIGMALGIFLLCNFKLEKFKRNRRSKLYLDLPLGLGSTLCIYFLFELIAIKDPLLFYLKYLFLGLWMSFSVSLICSLILKKINGRRP